MRAGSLKSWVRSFLDFVAMSGSFYVIIPNRAGRTAGPAVWLSRCWLSLYLAVARISGKVIDDFDLQAEIFSRYLIKALPGASAKGLYARRLRAGAGKVSAHDRKLLAFVLKHPWSLGLIDGGLALLDPQSEVRKRIYVMFAVLETQPEFWQDFLPASRNPFYIFSVAAFGLRAIFRALAGCILVALVRIT